jgi:hypothetical protein
VTALATVQVVVRVAGVTRARTAHDVDLVPVLLARTVHVLERPLVTSQTTDSPAGSDCGSNSNPDELVKPERTRVAVGSTMVIRSGAEPPGSVGPVIVVAQVVAVPVARTSAGGAPEPAGRRR